MELAAAAGLRLDPWEALVLEGALGHRPDDKWAALELGLIAPRQNGKGAILEARELAGLFLPLGEDLLLHTAHEFKTAQEAFLRVKALIDNTDDFRRQVTRVRTSHGEEGIELRGGKRLRFLARSTGSGRGFTGDVVILDEGYALTPKMTAALVPTLSARPNPQIWYTSSAGQEMSHSLAKIRARGIEGSPRLAYYEWSAPDEANLDDRRAWAQANPGLGIRISEEFIEGERDALDDADFARERLGIWPPEESRMRAIPDELWIAVCEAEVEAPKNGEVRFGLDIQPDHSRSAIAAFAEGVGELVDSRAGISGIADRAEELARHYHAPIVIDGNGPAVFIAEDLERRRGVSVLKLSNPEVYAACAGIYDAIADQRIRVRAAAQLDQAVAIAEKKFVAGDRFVWRRGGQDGDVTPLFALTLAFRPQTHRAEPFVFFG